MAFKLHQEDHSARRITADLRGIADEIFLDLVLPLVIGASLILDCTKIHILSIVSYFDIEVLLII